MKLIKQKQNITVATIPQRCAFIVQKRSGITVRNNTKKPRQYYK